MATFEAWHWHFFFFSLSLSFWVRSHGIPSATNPCLMMLWFSNSHSNKWETISMRYILHLMMNCVTVKCVGFTRNHRYDAFEMHIHFWWTKSRSAIVWQGSRVCFWCRARSTFTLFECMNEWMNGWMLLHSSIPNCFTMCRSISKRRSKDTQSMKQMPTHSARGH